MTPRQSSVSFETAAVGGFASLQASLPGDIRKRLGYLGTTRLLYGQQVLWEGQIEDMVLGIGSDSIETTLRAFGFKRKLEETSVRRVWSKRDLTWTTPMPGAPGAPMFTLAAVPFSRYVAAANTILQVDSGNYDPADLSKTGVKIAGMGVALAYLLGDAVQWVAPSGVTFQRVMLTGALTTSSGFLTNNFAAAVGGTTSPSSTWTLGSYGYAAGAISQSLTDSVALRIGVVNNSGGALTPTTGDYWEFTSIRVLGTTLSEDASGGYYGGTILRDLIALVPGLVIGMIEDGSDYTIQAIERAVRQAALSVVSEVAGYYTREWAVWEDGRFDWKTRNLDEAQWIVPLSSLSSIELDETVDGVAKTVYVLYTDAASDLDAEASAVATDQRNPYARQGITKDLIVTPGFPMTSNTSAQLAARIAGDAGARPIVSGRCEIAADARITNVLGATRPAFMVRGGDNIVIPELPVSEVFRQGRDGEALFHVASTSTDLSKGIVTLTLETQQNRTDVLLARLAAATRVLTG